MSESQHPRYKSLLLGGGAREHAIAEALCRSKAVDLYTLAHNYNPGLDQLSDEFFIHSERDVSGISAWATERGIDFAVVGLEDPLAVGLPDELAKHGIPTIGPTKEAACLETSKLFLRDLMRRHDIPGQVEYHFFDDADKLEGFLIGSRRHFALKPLGLTAGKGVKVMGVQLASAEEAAAYGRQVIEEQIGDSASVIAEERLLGEEFTLQAFVDGKSVIPMPLVKDFKLAYDGDRGPNTGSMGSYSQANGLLPYVTQETRDTALEILKQIVAALESENLVYKGIVYGQFCMTKQGPKIIEINARFGDPEAVNVLPLLETDFVDICQAIINGTLTASDVRFSRKATVCRYITPPGYPTKPEIGVPLRLNRKAIEELGVKVYYAKVDKGEDDSIVHTTTSRSIALVGLGDSVAEAESRVEEALTQHVHGRYHSRHDIGKGVLEEIPARETNEPAMAS